jgi:hypothetical protein
MAEVRRRAPYPINPNFRAATATITAINTSLNQRRLFDIGASHEEAPSLEHHG